MQKKPKANSVLTHAIQDGVLSLTFRDGANIAGCVTFDRTKASPANRDRAEWHGWVQRLSDGAAMSRNTETGKPASVADKMARVQAIATFYEAGGEEWRLSAVARPRGPDVGLVIRAMIRAYPERLPDVDACNAAFDKTAIKRGIDRDAAILVWAGTSQIIEALAAIARESAPTADDLLTDDTEAEEDEDTEDVKEDEDAEAEEEEDAEEEAEEAEEADSQEE